MEATLDDTNNDFDSGSFKDVYQTALGRDLWSFCKAYVNLIRMETAIHRSRF